MATDITVEELVTRRANEPNLVLLDVREPHEWTTAHVDGSLHIPMREIPMRLSELEKDAPIAVLCHHGGRSARVAAFLEANGYTNAVNVDGGIDAYSLRVDTKVPRY